MTDVGQCKTKVTFDSPQDIVDVHAVFWEAEEHPRALKVSQQQGFFICFLQEISKSL